MLKSGIHLPATLLDPKTAASQEVINTAFSWAFGSQHLFEFYEQPGNKYCLWCFSSTVTVLSATIPDALLTGDSLHIFVRADNVDQPILAAFDWKELKQNALVVDIGGGIGSNGMGIRCRMHLFEGT
jgi:hypothetical protein